MDAMPATALLATASGLQGPWGWIVRLIQALLTASLIAMALAWSSRAAARRRYRTKGTPQRPLLAYPLWTVGLGLGCIVLFSACAWFAWHSPPSRGGPKAALVFLVFVLLGVALVVSCLAESYVVDAAGIERLRFGRCRAMPWSDIARVSFPWGGPGIRLESRRGIRFEVAEMVDGFGVLCDALLLQVADGFRVVPEASMLVLRGSSLEGKRSSGPMPAGSRPRRSSPRSHGHRRVRAGHGPGLRRAHALAPRLLPAVRSALDALRPAAHHPWRAPG